MNDTTSPWILVPEGLQDVSLKTEMDSDVLDKGLKDEGLKKKSNEKSIADLVKRIQEIKLQQRQKMQEMKSRGENISQARVEYFLELANTIFELPDKNLISANALVDYMKKILEDHEEHKPLLEALKISQHEIQTLTQDIQSVVDSFVDFTKNRFGMSIEDIDISENVPLSLVIHTLGKTASEKAEKQEEKAVSSGQNGEDVPTESRENSLGEAQKSTRVQRIASVVNDTMYQELVVYGDQNISGFLDTFFDIRSGYGKNRYGRVESNKDVDKVNQSLQFDDAKLYESIGGERNLLGKNELILFLLSDSLSSPKFANNNLESERKKLLNQLKENTVNNQEIHRFFELISVSRDSDVLYKDIANWIALDPKRISKNSTEWQKAFKENLTSGKVGLSDNYGMTKEAFDAFQKLMKA